MNLGHLDAVQCSVACEQFDALQRQTERTERDSISILTQYQSDQYATVLKSPDSWW